MIPEASKGGSDDKRSRSLEDSDIAAKSDIDGKYSLFFFSVFR